MQPPKITVEWGVYVKDGSKKTFIPCASQTEAMTLVSKYSGETPLFGDPVIAKLIKRVKTVTVTYGNWKIA